MSHGHVRLCWLLGHKAAFSDLVMEKLGPLSATDLEWNGVRLLCLAPHFAHRDLQGVYGIIDDVRASVELIRCRRFDEDLLLLESVQAQILTEHDRSTAACPELLARTEFMIQEP
jgi:hypothetical protein